MRICIYMSLHLLGTSHKNALKLVGGQKIIFYVVHPHNQPETQEWLTDLLRCLGAKAGQIDLFSV